jgi:hypothetical protein
VLGFRRHDCSGGEVSCASGFSASDNATAGRECGRGIKNCQCVKKCKWQVKRGELKSVSSVEVSCEE